MMRIGLDWTGLDWKGLVCVGVCECVREWKERSGCSTDPANAGSEPAGPGLKGTFGVSCRQVRSSPAS